MEFLAVDRNVSASTQNQALNALVFVFKEILQRPLGNLGEIVRAQRPKRLPVVALVAVSGPVTNLGGTNPINLAWRGFVHGLRDLGWIDGRNFVIERRSLEGLPQRAPALFTELLARGVDVIALGGARWLHDAGVRKK